ncbi:MAG: DUF4401 domain-containing protein [Burkholderiales bacterium]|nr:DUF4401 domain-containing protein [Burkholderiales bacterium]
MNAMTREELWALLRGKALVEGDMPPAAVSSPWYVRVMLGIAGWIGALFLMGFVGAAFAFVMKSAAASLILGLITCAVACFIFRAARDNDFITQFGLAVSLAGQGMFMVGLINAFKPDLFAVFFGVALFEALLAALVPNALHRVLTSAAAVAALSYALHRLGVVGLAPGVAAAGMAMVWLDERRWADKAWRPVGYGIVLAMLHIEVTHSFQAFLTHEFSRAPGWLAHHGYLIGSGLTSAVFVWTVTRLLTRESIGLSSKTGVAAIVAAIVVGIVAFPAPGAVTALLILLLGFAASSRILMGLGIMALLGFVSHYYYQLQTTLLEKSAVLAAIGIALLVARLALHKAFLSEESEAAHA